MALAAVIFGKWNPIGAMLSSLFFGFAQSLSIIGHQLPGIDQIPSVYMQIAPYVITIIVWSSSSASQLHLPQMGLTTSNRNKKKRLFHMKQPFLHMST